MPPTSIRCAQLLLNQYSIQHQFVNSVYPCLFVYSQEKAHWIPQVLCPTYDFSMSPSTDKFCRNVSVLALRRVTWSLILSLGVGRPPQPVQHRLRGQPGPWSYLAIFPLFKPWPQCWQRISLFLSCSLLTNVKKFTEGWLQKFFCIQVYILLALVTLTNIYQPGSHLGSLKNNKSDHPNYKN